MNEQVLTKACEIARARVDKLARAQYWNSPIAGTSHEDLTQEVMLGMTSHWQEFVDEEEQIRLDDLLNYVAKATFNRYRGLAKKMRWSSQTETLDDVDLRGRACLRCRRLSPERQMVYREAVEREWVKIWSLPREHFTAFVLLHRDGYFGDDVASLILEIGLCSVAQLAVKMGIEEQELSALLMVEHRSGRDVGRLLGIAGMTANLKRAEAEKHIQGRPQWAGRTALGSAKPVRNYKRQRTSNERMDVSV